MAGARAAVAQGRLAGHHHHHPLEEVSNWPLIVASLLEKIQVQLDLQTTVVQ